MLCSAPQLGPLEAMSTAKKCIAAARKLAKQVDELAFGEPITHVYNPLQYAWKAHRQYLERYARSSCRVLMLGMNPGPWGMAQTGIPFGEISAVREWLQIDATIGKPQDEHPKRPIEGLACSRSEVSGKRLWGLFSEQFPSADAFFDQHFITNYCPLVFMESSAKNFTPDKLPKAEREPLEAICDAHLQAVISALQPEWLIGVGAFAEKRFASHANPDMQVGRILHPSPASPVANKGWAEAAEKQLRALGVWH